MRNAVFWMHLIAGLTAGVIIVIMSLTGVALAYEIQLKRWAISSYWQTPADNEQRLPVPGLVAFADESDLANNAKAATIRLYNDRAAPAELAYGRGGPTIFMNPYSGVVLGGPGVKTDRFLSAMRELHRWLLLPEATRQWGRWVTGVANAMFLGIILGGLYLWWPRHWSRMALASVLLIRPSLRGKPRDWNWHNAIGFWTAIPLALIVFAALPISFNRFGEKISNIQKPAATPPRPTIAPASQLYDGVEFALADARSREGWTMLLLTLPKNATDPLQIQLDHGNGRQPQLQRTIEYDRLGAVVRETRFEDQHLGQQMRRTLRFMHTGEIAGLAGQTVAMLVTALSLVLVWTGFALSWRRFTRKRKPRMTPAMTASTNQTV